METSSFREFFSGWAVQNLLVAVTLIAITVIVWSASRREYWRLAYREVRHRRMAVISFWILVGYAFIALLDSVGWRRPAVNSENGELLRNAQTGEVVYDSGHSALDYLLTNLRNARETTYSAPLATYESGHPDKPLAFPRRHLLGTDRIGEDVFFQALKSIRTGIIIGLLTTLLAVPFALFLGIVSGYFGGWIDDVLQYICVVLSSIPTILFIAAFMLIFGQGLPQLCFAMGIASWTGLYRLLRGETMRLREAEFVQAAVGLGVRRGLILLRHIVPNVLHLVLITAVLRFSSEVLAEAALTYLGIGVGADTMSWGTMINDARTELTRTPVVWWKLTAAFVFMLGLVLPANLFGDAVRDALDPRLRTQ
ncbi:MAG: ABC transporter permease [Victivallales bacterium]|nr:ABC transporter permease [Victivallales bacterium]